MTAQLHLAEDALALHLFLQRLEGLVDVVVTNENLHASFLAVVSNGRSPPMRRLERDRAGSRLAPHVAELRFRVHGQAGGGQAHRVNSRPRAAARCPAPTCTPI